MCSLSCGPHVLGHRRDHSGLPPIWTRHSYGFQSGRSPACPSSPVLAAAITTQQMLTVDLLCDVYVCSGHRHLLSTPRTCHPAFTQCAGSSFCSPVLSARGTSSSLLPYPLSAPDATTQPSSWPASSKKPTRLQRQHPSPPSTFSLRAVFFSYYNCIQVYIGVCVCVCERERERERERDPSGCVILPAKE